MALQAPAADPTDDEIFRAIYGQLRRFAAVVAPIEVEPDDLLQDALVETLRRHRLGDLDSPKAYLRKVMVNLASNRRRRFATERSALRAVGTRPEGATEDYPSDLADLLSLSTRQRAVLYLTDVEGLGFRDVAGLLGCSEPAARMAATRGRRRLRTAMAGEV